MSQHLVFVFGTLKSGFPNNDVNTGHRIDGDFRTAVAYPLFLVGDRHSPWLINMPGGGAGITGEVYEVDDEGLAKMDALERIDRPDGYERVTIEVLPLPAASAQPMQAFAYLKNARHLAHADIRRGPLAEYTLAHAALYRKLVA